MGFDASNPVHVQLRKEELRNEIKRRQADPTHPAYGLGDQTRHSVNTGAVGAVQKVQNPHPQPAPAENAAPTAANAPSYDNVALAPANVQFLPMAVPTGWALLHALGTIRQISLVAGGSRGYKLTVRITLHSGARVYRHGECLDPTEIDSLVTLFCQKGYWSPDKY
jgi:hypothetical protein